MRDRLKEQESTYFYKPLHATSPDICTWEYGYGAIVSIITGVHHVFGNAQEPSASGPPILVYNASSSREAARKLLQAASNVTATFGYQTTPVVASNFQSSFNTSQFNQALNVQGEHLALAQDAA